MLRASSEAKQVHDSIACSSISPSAPAACDARATERCWRSSRDERRDVDTAGLLASRAPEPDGCAGRALCILGQRIGGVREIVVGADSSSRSENARSDSFQEGLACPRGSELVIAGPAPRLVKFSARSEETSWRSQR